MYIPQNTKDFFQSLRSNRSVDVYSTLDLATHLITISYQLIKYSSKAGTYIKNLMPEENYTFFENMIMEIKDVIYYRLRSEPIDTIHVKILSVLHDIAKSEPRNQLIFSSATVREVLQNWTARDDFNIDTLRPSFESLGQFPTESMHTWMNILINTSKKNDAIIDEAKNQIEIHLRDGSLNKNELIFYKNQYGEEQLWNHLAQRTVLYEYDFHKRIDSNFIEPVNEISEALNMPKELCALIYALKLCNTIYDREKSKNEVVKKYYFREPIQNLNEIFSLYKLEYLKPLCNEYMLSLHGDLFDSESFLEAYKSPFGHQPTIGAQIFTIVDLIDNFHPEIQQLFRTQIPEESSLEANFDTDISTGSSITST